MGENDGRKLGVLKRAECSLDEPNRAESPAAVEKWRGCGQSVFATCGIALMNAMSLTCSTGA